MISFLFRFTDMMKAVITSITMPPPFKSITVSIWGSIISTKRSLCSVNGILQETGSGLGLDTDLIQIELCTQCFECFIDQKCRPDQRLQETQDTHPEACGYRNIIYCSSNEPNPVYSTCGGTALNIFFHNFSVKVLKY